MVNVRAHQGSAKESDVAKGNSFMRGVMIAVPISLACWATILIPLFSAI
jgi:hypothetical protein